MEGWGGVCGSRLGGAVLGGAECFVGNDAAIGHADQALGAAGQRFIMGDDDERGAGLGAAIKDEVDNGSAGGAIEIAGGFIGKQQRGARGKRAGDGDALLFAARKLAGIVMEAVAKADGLQFGRGAGGRIGDAGQFERGHHIFQRGHRGEQVEGLQHHPDTAAPGEGKPVFGQADEILPRHAKLAAAGAFQPREHGQQAGFAAARWAENGQHLAFWHIEIDALQNGGGFCARAECPRAERKGEGAGVQRGLAIGGLGHDKDMGILADAGKRAIQFMTLRAGFMVLAAVLALMGCKKAQAPVAGGAYGAGAEGAGAPLPVMPPAPQGPQVRIVALGDSLLAGYGLRPEEAYPMRLQAALRRAGVNAVVTNAGVSGDTTADGLARLEFTLGSPQVGGAQAGGAQAGGAKPDLVVISLGGNDMLRGLPVAQTRANMDAILGKLAQRKIATLVLGMRAAPNMGPDYVRGFDAIFPELTAKHGAGLVPFFLEGIHDQPARQLADHIHPNPQGVEVMVEKTLGAVKAALGG